MLPALPCDVNLSLSPIAHTVPPGEELEQLPVYSEFTSEEAGEGSSVMYYYSVCLGLSTCCVSIVSCMFDGQVFAMEHPLVSR